MSEEKPLFSDEERKILDGPVASPDARPAGKQRTRKSEDKPAEQTEKPAERGPLSPVQHDDDGWGDTPVQMRGQ